MVPVVVANVMVVEPHHQAIVQLREVAGDRAIAIWIGQAEALSIIHGDEPFRYERPTSHDILSTILDAGAFTYTRLEINDVEDGIFQATMVITNAHGEAIEIDSRPSDGIAVAARIPTTILVAEAVFDQVGYTYQEVEEDSESTKELSAYLQIGAGFGDALDEELDDRVVDELEAFRSFIDQVNPEDFLGP